METGPASPTPKRANVHGWRKGDVGLLETNDRFWRKAAIGQTGGECPFRGKADIPR